MSEFSQRPELRLLRSDRAALPLDALDLDAPVIQARFEWALRQGHPTYLWPDVAIHAWRACLFELERVVAWVLAGERPVRLELPRAVTARALGIAAHTAAVGPLLGYWLETGALEAEPEVGRLLRLHLEHSRLRTQRLSRALDELLRLLATVQVPVVLAGDGYTSAVYFPDPAMRPCQDLHVLVRAPDLESATSVLEAAGYRVDRRARPDTRIWRPPEAPGGLRSIELLHYDNDFQFKVRASLECVFAPARAVRLGTLDEHATTWRERGANAYCLREPAATALLALHMAEQLQRLPLMQVIELALVLRREYQDTARWADLAALLERAHAEPFAYPAFELVERLVPGSVDGDFRRYLASHAHRRLIRVVDGLRPASAQRVERLSLEDRLLWARGPWQTLRGLAHLLWPARDSLPHTYRTRLYQLLRGRVGLRARNP